MDWNLFIEAIGQWFSQHGTIFSVSTIFVGLAGWVAWYFAKRVIPNIANKLLMFVATTLGKLFGVDPERIISGVNTLPIVEDMKRQHEEYIATKEEELVKIKARLVSGKLTETERIAQEFLFDKITKDLGDSISEATLDVIKKLESK